MAVVDFATASDDGNCSQNEGLHLVTILNIILMMPKLSEIQP